MASGGVAVVSGVNGEIGAKPADLIIIRDSRV